MIPGDEAILEVGTYLPTLSSLEYDVFENDTEQTFVVRAIHLSNDQCSVLLNDENVFRPTDLKYGGHPNNAYLQRRGALLVPEGARLGVSPRPEVGVNTCEYYIEGDFVQP